MYTTKIKELRERIGLTKTEIGKILGIDRSQYGHYESDDFTIPIKHLITLCNYYNVSLDYIFEFSNIEQYKNSKNEIDKIVKLYIEKYLLQSLNEKLKVCIISLIIFFCQPVNINFK